MSAWAGSPSCRACSINAAPHSVKGTANTIYNCPLDQRCLQFLGVTAAALQAEVARGKSDGEILSWIGKKSKTKPSAWEIEQWSCWQDRRVPTDLESREYLSKYHKLFGPKREDIATWFDVLDLDDYGTFGGRA